MWAAGKPSSSFAITYSRAAGYLVWRTLSSPWRSNGLEVVDIENLRRHYALTLDVWADRFDRCWPQIHALDPAKFNERFRRIWRTYLIGCAEMFRSPHEQTHLFQIVFSKGNVTPENYPMSREYPYSRPTFTRA